MRSLSSLCIDRVQVLALLDRLAGTISQSFFFQNIWLVMLTTPRARGTALSYLSRRLPPFKAEEGKCSIPLGTAAD